MHVKHYDIPTNLDHLIAKKSTVKEKRQTKQTQFQQYLLKNRPEDYALDYLPVDDKFRLKERFKEEIDLKYILDNVGNYSLKPTTYRGMDETKKIPVNYRSYRSPRGPQLMGYLTQENRK